MVSWFLLLLVACACPRIAQAADELATLKSISTSDQLLRWDSINWFGDLGAVKREASDRFPSIQAILIDAKKDYELRRDERVSLFDMGNGALHR